LVCAGAFSALAKQHGRTFDIVELDGRHQLRKLCLSVRAV
jgi:hypothetical protein